ncbi:hypothetical protein Vadar_013848 [Vaccinium darrowii]|uniref:Uncharacterized protein n=1 Tax=Vaccinium darrowii TaxID=229202 RepID=A0ACB7X0F9_9ERIC|nr:hypothetical protein Vadar_013848 [Vaccinium darrowii]
MQSPSSQRTPSRTSPRGKGKATVDRPRARQRLQIEERAHWTSELTKDFLQCCANDIDQYGRTSISLDPAGWVRVNNAFNAITNSNYNKAQLKNRWDQLKRDWAAWIMLTESPRQTGLGWDEKNNTITAPDHWWGAMISRRKEAAKFRAAGLEHRDLMERVFRDVTAMGEGAYIPRTRQEQMEDVPANDSQELESEGTNPLGMEDPFQTTMKWYKSGAGGTSMATGYKSGGGGSSMAAGSASHGSTHKSNATKADLSHSINELLDHVKQNTQDYDRVQRAEAFRCVKALPIFRNMDDPEIEDLRWWALRQMEKMRKVETFLECDTDRQRHKWLYLENVAAIEEYRSGRAKDGIPPRMPPPAYD